MQKIAEIKVRSAEAVVREKEAIFLAIDRHREDSARSKPGFFQRLFRRELHRSWKNGHGAILAKLQEAQQKWSLVCTNNDQLHAEKIRLDHNATKLKADSFEKSKALAKEQSQYAEIANRHSAVFINEGFFQQKHQERQVAAPWLDASISRLRNDLFEAAVALQKAFVDGAAKPIRHNLNALLDGFGTRSFGSPEKDALIPDLWSTLFLVVPAVSSTFASISRMFGRIGPESFGWLLIDEAGQALPQAAVGALMRTNRAVVVGDPIQIEPVVVLPDLLTEAICKQFGIDPLIYNPPAASAQTLADSATPYLGTFETRYGTREVGVPLLVHRRCAEPMFSISNEVAYENLMVLEKTVKKSEILSTLGPSRWINVQGRGQDKWCPEEGEMVLKLLRQIKENGCKPDLYIITPFVVVQDRLRNLLISSGLLDGWGEPPRSWAYERVGTVHTVQGREAEAVIFVLGAPNAEQRGARGWAGARPNLLNVAITRAQEALYVIGNVDLWKDAGVFQYLHRRLN